MEILGLYNNTASPLSPTQETLPKLVSPLKNDELSIPPLAPNLSDLCDDDDRDENEAAYRYTQDQEHAASYDVYSDEEEEDSDDDEAMSSSSEESSIDDDEDDDDAAYDRYANVNYGAPTYLKSYPQALQDSRLGTIEPLIGRILRVRCVEDAVSQLDLLLRIIQDVFKTGASEREWADLLMVGGAQAVLCAMKKFPQERQLQHSGAAILSAMAESHEPSRIQIAASGGAGLLLNVVREHGSTTSIASWALRNLLMRRREGRSLKVDRRCLEFATEADGIQLLVKTLEQYGGDASICYGVCSCLNAMTASSIGNIMQAQKAGAVRALIKARELFRNVPAVQEQAESLLCHLNSVQFARMPRGMA